LAGRRGVGRWGGDGREQRSGSNSRAENVPLEEVVRGGKLGDEDSGLLGCHDDGGGGGVRFGEFVNWTRAQWVDHQEEEEGPEGPNGGRHRGRERSATPSRRAARKWSSMRAG